MTINDGGAAFPIAKGIEGFDKNGNPFARKLDVNEGLSLRDYFAAMALQGMCSNDDWNDVTWPRLADDAYAAADAMIAARDGKAGA